MCKWGVSWGAFILQRARPMANIYRLRKPGIHGYYAREDINGRKQAQFGSYQKAMEEKLAEAKAWLADARAGKVLPANKLSPKTLPKYIDKQKPATDEQSTHTRADGSRQGPLRWKLSDSKRANVNLSGGNNYLRSHPWTYRWLWHMDRFTLAECT